MHLNVKRSAHAMCHWRHVTCDIRLEGDIVQIMPGLEGDLEEWQTQEVNSSDFRLVSYTASAVGDEWNEMEASDWLRAFFSNVFHFRFRVAEVFEISLDVISFCREIWCEICVWGRLKRDYDNRGVH